MEEEASGRGGGPKESRNDEMDGRKFGCRDEQ